MNLPENKQEARELLVLHLSKRKACLNLLESEKKLLKKRQEMVKNDQEIVNVSQKMVENENKMISLIRELIRKHEAVSG